MKKLIAAALLITAGLGAVYSEDIMFGNGYYIGMDGIAGAAWDAEEPIPVLELIEIHEEEQSATLYYAVDYEEFIETVSYEDYSAEYGDVVTIEFYSDSLGPVTFHMSGDAEVNADELWAVLASYMIDTELGYLTYIGIAAMESLQKEQEEMDAFSEFVADMKEDYGSEM